MLESTTETPSINAWASLLGLLTPLEYFVTVDHSVLWQRHVAWAKPKGEDLRQYVTQRFASNMIVLSLMLGAQINVFFNSAKELSEMRNLLGSESYGDLKFWIGIVIALDAVVTIMALVATFTLWGMISAISDSNTHALLRSSIGQYVISMPPRFVVGALYLFVFWLLLFFMDLMSGPSRIVLALVVLCLFFEVIIPLSSFGRLIIHTGAMAKRRVLEEDFEKELLPSGLHASLLIRATGQRRKYASAIHQYRKKSMMSQESFPMSDASDVRSNYNRTDSVPSIATGASTSFRMDSAEEKQIEEAAQSLFPPLGDRLPPLAEKQRLSGDRQRLSERGKAHRRTISGDCSFPRASILNSVSSTNLHQVVELAITESERETDDDSSKLTEGEGTPQVNPLHRKTQSEPLTITTSLQTDTIPENMTPSVVDSKTTPVNSRLTTPTAPSTQKSFFKTPSKSSVSKPRRSTISREKRPSTSKKVLVEWAEESTVRKLYEAPPPPLIFDVDDSVVAEVEAEMSSRVARRPRPSFLNRERGLDALAELIQSEHLDTPDSSIGDAEELEEDRLVGRVVVETKHSAFVSPMGTDRKRKPNDVEAGFGERSRLLPSGSGTRTPGVYGRQSTQ